jgi:hypothetical protein
LSNSEAQVLTLYFISDESTLDRLRRILGNDFPFYISGSIFDQQRIDWIRQQPGFMVMDYHMVGVEGGWSRQPSLTKRFITFLVPSIRQQVQGQICPGADRHDGQRILTCV